MGHENVLPRFGLKSDLHDCLVLDSTTTCRLSANANLMELEQHRCVDESGALQHACSGESPLPAESASLAGYRFPAEVILLAVRWYLRYGLSYRDVEELLADEGSRLTTSPSLPLGTSRRVRPQPAQGQT